MSQNNNIPPKFIATTDILLNPLPVISHFPKLNLPYVLSEGWVKELGPILACLYAKINFLSSYQPFCYASNFYLARETNVTIKTIEKRIKRLEDKGYIYRNTYSKWGGGRIRQIVTQERAPLYYKIIVSKNLIPQNKIDKFFPFYLAQELEKFNPIKNKTLPNIPPPTPLNVPPHNPIRAGSSNTPRRRGGSILPKDSIKGTTQRTEISPKKEPYPNPTLSKSAVVLLDGYENDKSLVTGLVAAQISMDQIEIALNWCKIYPEKVEGAKSLIALLRSGLRDGWIQRELREYEQDQLPILQQEKRKGEEWERYEKRQRASQEKRDKESEAIKLLSAKNRLACDSFLEQTKKKFNFDREWNGIIVDTSKERTPDNFLVFHDPEFNKKFKELVNESLYHPWKASGLG